MNPDGLICAAHAIGGFLNHRGLTLDQRCRAARDGGFRRIGWALDDYRRERAAGQADADILATLDRHGVAVAEVEFVMIGTGGSADGPDSAETRADLLHFAALVGARHLVCGAGGPDAAPDLDAIVRDYRALCEAAAERGVLALLEAMPWSRISTLAGAADVVAAADHPAGGVMLDTWHFHRVGGVPDDVRAVPAEMIRLIQISDAGAPVGDLYEDTVTRRLFPGDGGFALVRLMQTLARHGVRASVSIEVIGEAADRLSATDMARRCFTSTASVLAEAGYEAGV